MTERPDAATIEERQRQEREHQRARDANRHRTLQRSWYQLEQLEERQEVPLGARNVGRVGWIGGRFEARARELRQRHQHDDHKCRDHDVLCDDVGPESDARSLRSRVLLLVVLGVRWIIGTRRRTRLEHCRARRDALPDHLHQMHQGEPAKQHRKEEHVQCIEPRQRRGAELRAAAQQLNQKATD